MAESWGCKVLSLTELVKELRRLKPLPKKDEISKKNAPAAKGKKLAKLHECIGVLHAFCT